MNSSIESSHDLSILACMYQSKKIALDIAVKIANLNRVNNHSKFQR